MNKITVAFAPIVVALLSPGSVLAQSPQSPGLNASLSVPRLINISSVFQPADGQPPAPVEVVTLSIYAEPEGGLPIWQETQTVAVDRNGRFSVLLGAAQPDGLPLEVFGSGEAQWMSVLFARAGEVERPRVRIASVPYALKARDADTLGGLPASAYLLAPSSEGAAGRSTGVNGEDSLVATDALMKPQSLLAGTTNSLAKYVNSVDVGSSAVFETGGRVGIGTTSPLDGLHVRFNNSSGSMTGLAVQNLGNTSASYSGMLFYDQFGALGQFQGFNNVTHEYRINNIATNPSINFMLGGASWLKMDTTLGTTVSGPFNVFPGGADIGLFVGTSGVTGLFVENTNSEPLGSAAVDGRDSVGIGVYGATDTGAAIFGRAFDVVAGWAGYFDGDVNVTGFLFKGGGAFRIDHPLDPENKYLSHSFVESPDMKNIYDGVAVLNEAGEAIVTLPDWFEALNGDFRYQLTPMGAAFVPYVAEEIAGNQFKIGGGIAGKKVSWQVTGIRHDAFANANRIQVEELKPDGAVGTYLHPEAFGQPVERDRSTLTTADSKATGQDREAARAGAMKARIRAIGQKPAKR